ncbi:MAG: type II toxin-antitoxin system MqsA family antitoxin [Byssovorax sp.]
MRCIVCKHGETEPGVTTLSVDRAGHVIVIRSVPAEVCSTCGEEYLSAEVMKALEAEVQQAERAGIEVAVRSFQAA